GRRARASGLCQSACLPHIFAGRRSCIGPCSSLCLTRLSLPPAEFSGANLHFAFLAFTRPVRAGVDGAKPPSACPRGVLRIHLAVCRNRLFHSDEESRGS